AEDGIRDLIVTGVQTCALPICKRLHRIAKVFDDGNLHDLTTNDVFWDKIVEITSIGKHDVYDGSVNGTHNFVANLISLHNSLERSEERRVGKECRSWWWAEYYE